MYHKLCTNASFLYIIFVKLCKLYWTLIYNYMNIRKLNELITASKLNKIQIAAQSGISRTTLDNLLIGADSKISTLESVMAVLDIPVGYVFDEDVSIKKQSVSNDVSRELENTRAENLKLQGKIELLTEQLHDAQELYRRASTFDGLAAEPVNIPKKKENA